MSDPFCTCGHRRSDHDESLHDWLDCDECDCELYQRARGEVAKEFNEGKPLGAQAEKTGEQNVNPGNSVSKAGT